MASQIKAKCKNCGKEAPVDQYKLHYQLKMMVCPNCFSGKTQKEKEEKDKITNEVKSKPPGWDQEDDYLQKYVSAKKASTSMVFTKVPGSDLMKCNCPSCKYSFKYDPFKRVPRSCPYCSAEVPKINNYNTG